MIGCGKSTLSAKYAKDGYLVLNDDSIVNAVHGNNYLLYNKKHKSLYKHIGNTIFAFAAATNTNLIIDRTNLSKETRARYLSMAREFGMTAKCILFEPTKTPEEYALKRFNSDSRGATLETWNKVAKEHISQYTKPTVEEGFTEVVAYEIT